MPITQGFTPIAGCQGQAVAINGKILLYNFEDWINLKSLGNITIDATPGTQAGTITNITNPALVQAYAFNLARNSPKPSSPIEKSDSQGGLIHTLSVNIPDASQASKDQIAGLINCNLVTAIVYFMNDNVFTAEVYGINSGLELSAGDGVRNVKDTANALTLTLTSPSENTSEITFPTNVFDNDYQTTIDMLDLLTIPGTP